MCKTRAGNTWLESPTVISGHPACSGMKALKGNLSLWDYDTNYIPDFFFFFDGSVKKIYITLIAVHT